jgi:hypothetical protein
LLEQRLGDLVEPSERERLTGSVAVHRQDARYEVELSIDLDGRPLGTRRFEVESCARAAETAAVAASLAVYQGEGEPPGAAASGISPDIWSRRPEPTPDFSRPRAKAPPATSRALEPRLGLLGTAAVGTFAKPSWAGTIVLELGLGRRWSLAALGHATLEQERALDEPKVVYLSALAATARACVAHVLGTDYRLDACTGAHWVRVRGRAEGFDVNRTASLTWLAPLLGVDFSVRAPSRIEWRWEMDASLPLSRRRFLADGGEVSRPSVIVGALRLGALVRF